MATLIEEKKSGELEAYKMLRTNIHYYSVENPIKTILITSSEAKEGKTTVSCNLAKSFAENGQSVIVIDCDLRKPSIHKMFEVSNLKGITDVIIGEEKLDDVIQKYNEKINIISSGKIPPNPSEMVGSNIMKNLINYLRNIYDIIIIDSPPVGIVTDAQILSTQVDGTIVVLKAEKTKTKKLIDAINLLKKVNANIIGVVLNNVNIDTKCYKSY